MDAPVTGAGPADQRELLPQRLAGAMDADSGRVHTPLDEVEKLAALLDQPGD